jgi:hypothetical protein
MENDRILDVEVQEDFVEKLAAARPAQALAELIWNGLDAEATRVDVYGDHGPLGLSTIRVRDNGHGIAPAEVDPLFTKIGGSWKRTAKQSRNGKRILHGEEGRGRFRALALGRTAEWSVTAADAAGIQVRYRITMIKDSARNVRISDAVAAGGDSLSGVEVAILEPYRQWDLEAKGLLQELSEIYALYLTDYPEVNISVAGVKLDPSSLIQMRKTFTLPAIADNQKSYDTQLEVVEWETSTERMLYLCSGKGFPLHRISPGIQAPGFDFLPISDRIMCQLCMNKVYGPGRVGPSSQYRCRKCAQSASRSLQIKGGRER